MNKNKDKNKTDWEKESTSKTTGKPICESTCKPISEIVCESDSVFKPKTFQIWTLGCKVNQYESEQIRQALCDLGFISPTDLQSRKELRDHSERNYSGAQQDFVTENQGNRESLECRKGGEKTKSSLTWVIVNTCAVTQESEAKSRKLIRQMIKRYQPEKVLVFGCSAEHDTEQYSTILGVTHVVTGEKHGGNRVAAVLEAILKTQGMQETLGAQSTLGTRGTQEVLETQEARDLEVKVETCRKSLAGGLRRFGERHRAYVKVQDGCRQFCTYCLIPHLRHELTSVPVEEVRTEIRSLLHHGYKEIVITGIHLGYYGLNIRSRTQNIWTIEDRTQPRQSNLTELMNVLAHPERFGEEWPEYRLRISSLEAHEAGDDLLQIMAENRSRICPHLHLSMQSGSPTVHRRMNRPGTVEQYVERCLSARKILDNPAITTDIIVGFPGETEKEFLETCDVVRQVGFSKIHIFPFSARPGTPAAEMGNWVPTEEKHRRELYLTEIEREMHEKYVQSLAGRKMQFLAERFHPETEKLTGTSEYYIQAEFPGKKEMVGTFVEY
ncbi:MAG: MiaB/RimO family radical SAM methylthiotransferase [Planctomycetia bacterium]|nr:MiaB/RimO family radical SAM methylthiotransferase [Planctomycetia bacterium]